MVVNPLDVLAAIFGVLYTVRKLDAQARSHSEFSHVPADAFAAWQTAEVSSYGFGALACVLKLVVGLSYFYLVAPHLPVTLMRILGAAIDLSWVAAVGLTFYRGHKLRLRRAQLGIILGVRLEAPADGDSDDD
jgi:hypothetical protein